jgi:predicted nucleic acid-binding protein
VSAVVVDASVAAKLLFEEEGSAEAEAALSAPGLRLLAPDLLVAEVGSVIWKRARRGEISAGQAGDLLDRFLMLPVELRSAGEVATEALELAIILDRSVYDCLYLALAIMSDTVMLTMDVRLANAVGSTPLGAHIRSVRDG